MRSYAVRKFWERVDRTESGCWIWRGKSDRLGYGRTLLVTKSGRSTYAHRIAYFLTTGEWPKELDHLCRNRLCVNPAHLEPVTHKQNMSRGAHALKMFCPRGHPLGGDNLYIYPQTESRPNGARGCRTCMREASRKSKQQRKERAVG